MRGLKDMFNLIPLSCSKSKLLVYQAGTAIEFYGASYSKKRSANLFRADVIFSPDRVAVSRQ